MQVLAPSIPSLPPSSTEDKPDASAPAAQNAPQPSDAAGVPATPADDAQATSYRSSLLDWPIDPRIAYQLAQAPAQPADSVQTRQGDTPANPDNASDQNGGNQQGAASKAHTNIDPLTAAQLSCASYPDFSPPEGWNVKTTVYGKDANGDRDQNTLAVILTNDDNPNLRGVSFKGTDNFSNLKSDLLDSGGQAWESLKGAVRDALNEELKACPDCEVIIFGQSLGAGIGQTFALEDNYSGYGINALPISQMAITNDQEIIDKGGIVNAINNWSAAGNTFHITNVAGDPATFGYSTVRQQVYLDSNPTTLPKPGGVVLEILGIAAQFIPGVSLLARGVGALVTALAAKDLHSCDTAIDILQAQQGSNVRLTDNGVLAITHANGSVTYMTSAIDANGNLVMTATDAYGNNPVIMRTDDTGNLVVTPGSWQVCLNPNSDALTRAMRQEDVTEPQTSTTDPSVQTFLDLLMGTQTNNAGNTSDSSTTTDDPGDTTDSSATTDDPGDTTDSSATTDDSGDTTDSSAATDDSGDNASSADVTASDSGDASGGDVTASDAGVGDAGASDCGDAGSCDVGGGDMGGGDMGGGDMGGGDMGG